MEKGLVMEGGAMRGLYTAGVTDVLMKYGIKFDGAVGVSAGVTFGCNYKSLQPGRVLRYNLRYGSRPQFKSWRSWLKTGDLYGADFCYYTLPEVLDPFDTAAFARNPMDFWCVATDVETAQPAYHKLTTGKGRDVAWIRASASIPVFARPVKIGGHAYWDGGVSDSIPVRFLLDKGYDKAVVILTQPAGYQKEPSRLQPVVDRILKKYPAVVARLRQRHVEYNACLAYIAKEEAAGRLFVFRPSQDIGVSAMEKDPNRLKAVYRVGVRDAKRQLAALKEFLQD
ncbi:patatin-like phospholipase family protein [Lactobacillus delbrueckii]|uniref:Patatin family protein n=1 Tax=Lactobacillus delbrueckii subsp. lactis TaxID=29397 RepID=A0ABD4SDU6_LACDL|nr:patatin family protein [Lactobacillus delbrueckii]MCD5433774.1 patatin family protein [Lactobacillus delbrueckii subsp. lactis]MCD5515067.1 patatin family protein [Lactobacillus delbrueckii subsp. lactis]MCD5520925.1 patatin family protein [Lactobacillus delbrueckii subsp. lactis]MCD5560888.1 patatin family protein [Lactobacillus delbrueckii subsp. lactis]MCD5562668.1 patatin family protein [Lactobacillus delbrueckii subsp. lactis]